MSRKIKFHAFQVLFRLFAFLADKSGGWRVFVRPKLLIGSIIVGLGLTVPGHIQAQNQNINQQQKKKSDSTDTPINKTKVSKPVVDITCYITIPVTQEYEEKVFEFTDQKPLFPGGETELTDYISKNLKYPKIAKENGIQGKVICRFVITKTGLIEKVEVVRLLDPLCDKEAIRLVKSLPKFIPGKQNGVNVNVWYILPIIFKLTK
jgi:protein TonB